MARGPGFRPRVALAVLIASRLTVVRGAGREVVPGLNVL